MEKVKSEYEELKEKYKARYLQAVETEEEEVKDDDLEEKEVIDVKEL